MTSEIQKTNIKTFLYLSFNIHLNFELWNLTFYLSDKHTMFHQS